MILKCGCASFWHLLLYFDIHRSVRTNTCGVGVLQTLRSHAISICRSKPVLHWFQSIRSVHWLNATIYWCLQTHEHRPLRWDPVCYIVLVYIKRFNLMSMKPHGTAFITHCQQASSSFDSVLILNHCSLSVWGCNIFQCFWKKCLLLLILWNIFAILF